MVSVGSVCFTLFARESVHQRTKLMHKRPLCVTCFVQTFNHRQFSLTIADYLYHGCFMASSTASP